MAKNYKVRFNGNRLSIPGPVSKKNIKQVLEAEKFDVLHVQVPYSPLLAARVIKYAPASCAVVGTFHIFPAGILSRIGSRLLHLALLPTLKKFNKIVSVSPASAQFAQSAFGIKPEVVPNAVNIAGFKATKRETQDGIVFLGRLVQRKGCQELLEAFALLHQKMPSVKLTIAGDGPDRSKLEAFVKTKGLSEVVKFEGFVSNERRAELLAGAAIACFPSLYGEAFGIVLIEAMAAGAGVVLGGDNPGYQSVLGGRPETLFDPKNKAALAQILEDYLTNKTKAANVHAYQQGEINKYDVGVVGKELLGIYNQSIAKQRAFRA